MLNIAHKETDEVELLADRLIEKWEAQDKIEAELFYKKWQHLQNAAKKTNQDEYKSNK